MGLPFTPGQFFGVFAEYNHAFWSVAVALWLASAGLLAAAWRNPSAYGRLLTLFLGVLWAWNAVAYHLYLFTRINPAAWVFGTMFAVQALLLLWTARRPPEYLSSRGAGFVLGTGLILYSFAYPALSAIGHGYPATPTFGVPCPTDIFTIGLLLTVAGGVPRTLAIVPLLWAFIGGSAALLLDAPADYVLLAAGVMLAAALVMRWRRPTPASR